MDHLCATWKSKDCPGGPPNVLPRLPLFDGVGSPKFPNPSLPETLIPNKTLYLLVKFLYFFLSKFRSLISAYSFLLALRTYLPISKTIFIAQKSNNDSRFHIIKQRATNCLSHFALIASSFEVWIEGGLILGNWQGNGSDKRSGMGHD